MPISLTHFKTNQIWVTLLVAEQGMRSSNKSDLRTLIRKRGCKIKRILSWAYQIMR
jgi:hypothetical protein